jgi:hypothetical protein
MTDEVFTLSFNYDSGSSESVSFGPTDIFATPQGLPLELDLTGLKYADGKNDDKLSGITLRNPTASPIGLDSIDISWSGGVASQRLEKGKKKKNGLGGEIKIEGSFNTPYNWPINTTLGASAGGGACEYSLALEYTRVDADTGVATTGYTSSLTFDDGLTGVGGTDLEIDLDQAALEDAGSDISCIRVRSRIEDLVVITGTTVTSQDATANQWLQEVDDRTDPATVLDLFTGTSILDANTDVAAGGLSFSPLVGVGGISVGGIVAGTQNCPAGVNWDDPPGPGGGGDDTPPPDGDPPPDGEPPPPPPPPSPDPVPLTRPETGFNITNTTGSGNNQRGRLMWREIVR